MGTDSLYYIRDYSGNYYRINNVNELVAVRNETDATVFNYDQARSHIGTGKKNDISEPVSYTHLTLPTNREVEISEVAVSLKKK